MLTVEPVPYCTGLPKKGCFFCRIKFLQTTMRPCPLQSDTKQRGQTRFAYPDYYSNTNKKCTDQVFPAWTPFLFSVRPDLPIPIWIPLEINGIEIKQNAQQTLLDWKM